MMSYHGAITQSGFTPGADTARAFRDALGRFATGVTIVTINRPTGPMGFTANSFSSLSMDPPLVLWSLAKSAQRYPYFAGAQHFAIHVLAAEQLHLIDRFHRTGPGFDGLKHDLGAHGVPLFDGALARFECELHTTYEGGDHLIVVGRVHRVVCEDGAPLVFLEGRFRQFPAMV
jgi:flavin reductase (DIM6/NTAB) family NADH-FMN oxidoreductase RutF